MRVFIAAFATETNAFSPLPGTLEGFERGVLFRGDATSHPSTLFTEPLHVWRRCATADGIEVIEGLSAMAQPSGPLRRQTYEQLRDEILNALRAAHPVNLVLLMLHGAMAAQGHDDCEGDIVQRVREIVGNQAQIGVLLDLHGSVSDLLLQEADLVTCCHLYPHTDFGERAGRLYRALRAVQTGRKPAVAHSRIDMLGFFPTTTPAMAQIVERMRSLEERADVLAVSLVHGFPWSDTRDTGAGVIVITDSNPALAQSLAMELAEEFVRARHTTPELLDVTRALNEAEYATSAPVVIADVCDNAGGGAPGDSTFLLAALLQRDLGNVALALLWDPQTVSIASDAGEGAWLPLRIGGKTAVTSGAPLDVQAEVVRIVDDPQQRGLAEGTHEPLGRSVLLRMGRVQVVVNSNRQQVFSPDCFTEFGVKLSEQRILVVKSSQHFARQFGPIAARFIYCHTPGCLTFDFGALPYQNLRRPMWPLDRGEPQIRFARSGYPPPR